MRRPTPLRTKIIILSVLVCVGVAGAILFGTMRNREPGKLVAIPQKESLTVFIPAAGGRLTKKMVELKNGLSEKDKAAIIVAELKKEKAVPENLSLHESATDAEGIMYLNFSQELKSAKANPLNEITTVYSLVNSFLSNFAEAKSVQILVEGQALYTINGLLYTYAPIEFNNQLVEE